MEATERWTPETFLRLRTVSQVRVSPDATQAVFVVGEAVCTDDKSEYVSQLHACTIGQAARPLTFGERSAANPRWSPDGQWIAFTTKRGSGEKVKTNVFRLPAHGPGEAAPLVADPKSDIGEFRWSPDGSKLAFVMADPPPADREARTKGKDDWRWVGEEIPYGRLYVVTVAADGTPADPTCLTSENYHVTSFDWAPDSSALVYSHQKTPRVDHWPTTQLARVTLDGTTTPLTVGGAAAIQPHWSPDGRWIAFTRSDNPAQWAFFNQIHLLPADATVETEPRALPVTADGQPGLIGWSADSTQLYFSEASGTKVQLSAMTIATGAITPISDGDGFLHDGFELNTTRTHVGFRLQATDRPVEAYASPLAPFLPVALSTVNAAVGALPIATTELRRWTSPDGTPIEGLLTLPLGYTPGQRVPLLLEIHGGPAGVYLQTFIGGNQIYPMASFAAQGYAILRSNPRGSGGYGQSFRYANQGDWGGGDFADLMAGVDSLIAEGIADPERLGVMGWSYGGFMTSWVITQTSRFKAASIGAPVTHLISFTGTSDIQGFLPSYFGGQFWESNAHAAIYHAHSPLAHVAAVTTPALIQHPEADERVPISQGYELYYALLQRGIETRMLVLPRQPHGPTEPKMQLQCLRSNYAWFTERV